MQLGKAGEALIKSFETLQLKAYKAVPTEQYYTWGWGHYGPDVVKGGSITLEQAQALFDKDVSGFVKAVNNAVKVPLSQNQFDALVSLAFNIGATNFSGSTLVKLLNTGAYAAAAEQFARWNKSGGAVLAGLTRRRLAERDLFLK